MQFVPGRFRGEGDLLPQQFEVGSRLRQNGRMVTGCCDKRHRWGEPVYVRKGFLRKTIEDATKISDQLDRTFAKSFVGSC